MLSYFFSNNTSLVIKRLNTLKFVGWKCKAILGLLYNSISSSFIFLSSCFMFVIMSPSYIIRDVLSSLTPDPLDLFRYSGKNLLPNGSGLKFYNLHQTLNTSINALNSFTDIYLISSARSGFVFFISFTNFFLTFIVPLYPISPYLSSLVLGACCLVK